MLADAPFRCWVLDDFAPPALLPKTALPDGLPWVKYDNDCERGKRTCNNVPKLPADWRRLMTWLNSPYVAENLGALAGVAGLRADSSLWGAGIHVTDPGGWLQPHLDYSLHASGMERRVSLILFLNPQWREEWGGAFEAYDAAARECVGRVRPAFNRAVIFENGDLAYHGTQATAADAPPRVTAAAYFLAPPRPGTVRRRALFVPRR